MAYKCLSPLYSLSFYSCDKISHRAKVLLLMKLNLFIFPLIDYDLLSDLRTLCLDCFPKDILIFLYIYILHLSSELTFNSFLCKVWDLVQASILWPPCPVTPTAFGTMHFSPIELLLYLCQNSVGRDFLDGPVVKNLPANAGRDTGSIPGPGRSHMPRAN